MKYYADNFLQTTDIETKFHIKKVLKSFNRKKKIEITDLVFLEEDLEKIKNEKVSNVALLNNTNVFINQHLNIFQRKGDFRFIQFQGIGVDKPLKDYKGFPYIEYLLKHPHELVSIEDLFHNYNPVDARYVDHNKSFENIKELKKVGIYLQSRVQRKKVDRKAIRAAEIELKDINEILKTNEYELDKYEDLCEKKTKLEDFLKSSSYSGKIKNFSDEYSKKYQAVTMAIRRGIKILEKHHKEFAQHLSKFIKKGRNCSYIPAEKIL